MRKTASNSNKKLSILDRNHSFSMREYAHVIRLLRDVYVHLISSRAPTPKLPSRLSLSPSLSLSLSFSVYVFSFYSSQRISILYYPSRSEIAGVTGIRRERYNDESPYVSSQIVT